MDGRFGPNYENGNEGIHGPPIWSEFLEGNVGSVKFVKNTKFIVNSRYRWRINFFEDS